MIPKPYDLKIIEDYSDLDATTVADDIVEQSEDTPTLLDTYIEQTDTTLDKGRLKTLMKSCMISSILDNNICTVGQVKKGN